jgi:hypothetical protein
LQKVYKELSINYPHCSIELFDVDAIFTQVYQKPADYHFDAAKFKVPYIKSEAFRINQDGTSPATGYMFWDDVHPTADMHALLADMFYLKFSMKYGFSPPQADAVEAKINVSEDLLLKAYQNVHAKKVAKQQTSLFRGVRRPRAAREAMSLENILELAIHGGDRQALSTLKELQWLNKQGGINLNIPVLKKALRKVNAAHAASQGNVHGEDPRAPLLVAAC